MTDPTPPGSAIESMTGGLDLQLLDHDAQYGGKEPSAVERISKLESPTEMRTALLALLLPAKSDRSLRVFQQECADVRGAETLRELAEQIEPADRLPWIEALLSRMRSQPVADRQALVNSTRQVLAARGTVRPIDRLHWMLMRRRLGENLRPTTLAPGARDISQLPDKDVAAIAAFSAFLSRLVPNEPADSTPAAFEPGLAWYASAMKPWAQRWSIPPCDMPASEVLTQALQELQALPWMQRPSLVRGWVTAAIDASPEGKLSRPAADALRLSCALLDSPMPPELSRHFGADPEERPR
jgi:hypothetical protein